MERIVARDPRNLERIVPYLGGEELNESPTHSPRRYVIDFGEMSEAEAWRWPDLMALLEEKSRPIRARLTNKPRVSSEWWLFEHRAPALRKALAGLDRMLVIARVSATAAFTFLSSRIAVNEKVVVFPTQRNCSLALLQSRVHEVWARFFSATLKDDLQYTPSDCFDTFPFPRGWESIEALEGAGRAYCEFRAPLMVRNDEGLTKTYHRFHDRDERSPEILKLRDLHAAMDRVVLDAYGWTDLQPACEFLLDYEEEESDDPSAPKSKKKKPRRYRWPDAFRDEVLARLLALNAERARDEALASQGGEGERPKQKSRTKKPPSSKQTSLLGH